MYIYISMGSAMGLYMCLYCFFGLIEKIYADVHKFDVFIRTTIPVPLLLPDSHRTANSVALDGAGSSDRVKVHHQARSI